MLRTAAYVRMVFRLQFIVLGVEPAFVDLSLFGDFEGKDTGEFSGTVGEVDDGVDLVRAESLNEV